jgi:hypothetical protein
MTQRPGFELVDTSALGERKPALDFPALRWVLCGLIGFWLALVFTVPGLLDWLLRGVA